MSSRTTAISRFRFALPMATVVKPMTASMFPCRTLRLRSRLAAQFQQPRAFSIYLTWVPSRIPVTIRFQAGPSIGATGSSTKLLGIRRHWITSTRTTESTRSRHRRRMKMESTRPKTRFPSPLRTSHRRFPSAGVQTCRKGSTFSV